ncbi:ABC-2 type transporter-domain-containing protein [Piptocephalis cylindrospora]|uniref:ABC-2 type transporter-domain-containing protein n=1 Tax=Piptocephalis cylindrospora TaxID=1907219 RepID=A0A4P9XZL4_9FUNG|nr:ABC-2 type transporter-domain-containing protein [Piptocephalis cylindrospora]|eukprot:RKP11885.1 ABC-2 type transporter-domain-containing protein [Piptocephalis cylindrospora]
MGVFFFVCALFAFSCLSSLPLFASERVIFVRERANGYYSPIPYYLAKVLFDILPLRVVPPLLLGAIIYPMVGLVPDLPHFARFLSVLVAFNLTAASICLVLGIMIREVSVANLTSSLVMLFSMLFGGLLLNKDSMPGYLQWLKNLSFFHYAFEALIVNEMVYLQLIEKKYGLEIDVPGATILSTFGFDATAYLSDLLSLLGMWLVLTLFAGLFLALFVRERR